MAEEIIISVSPHESRVAVVDQGLLQEIFIERTHSRGTVGNIYYGKVARILPGLQSAFVDIGQQRSAFMHINDLVDSHEALAANREENFQYPPINEVLHDGKELLIQVSKEPIGTKGARITSNISLASRYLVYLPGSTHLGISQRIEEETERDRLRGILVEIQSRASADAVGDGFIIRTASEGVSAEALQNDAELLRSRWSKVKSDSANAKPESLIYEDLPLPLRVMRDLINPNTSRIVVDDVATSRILQKFLEDFIPEKSSCMELAEGSVQLFDAYNLEDQIDAALDRNLALKSGGYLVFDQTEAMTTVDVNSGAFVGKKDLEDTIYKTNLEAAAAIPRQLRLRNMGGIVIIDFIDMINEEHKRQVLRTLEKGQQADRVKWNITEISELGLVEMTRKRTHQSLLKMMCEPCVTCNGRGFIKTAESVCLEIFREIQRNAIELSKNTCLIMAAQPVIDRLLDEDAQCIQQLANSLGKTIRFQVETSYSQEQFDVVLTFNER